MTRAEVQARLLERTGTRVPDDVADELARAVSRPGVDAERALEAVARLTNRTIAERLASAMRGPR